MRPALFCTVALAAIITGGSLLAQTPAFEVASVKAAVAAGGSSPVGLQPGGRFFAMNVPLRTLIRIAYGLEENQLVGGPDWVSNARFEVSAIAGRDVSREEGLAMLRTLLAERFALATHPETRQLPIYELALARADGRWGNRMRRSETQCAGVALPTLPGGVPPPPPPPVGPAQIMTLGVGAPLRCPSMFIQGWISAREVTMEILATRLSPLVGRPVVDRTRITGVLDVDLAYTPDPALGPSAPFAPADGASIFTAVQEQLGLKLEPARGPVQVMVIDRVEKPTEN